MREDVLESMILPVDGVLFSQECSDPLDAVEAGLVCLFDVLDGSPLVRETLEIMMNRCEYVDEIAGIEKEVARPGWEFLAKIDRIYQLAAAAGTLRADLAPASAAWDTWAFVEGLLHLMVRHPRCHAPARVAEMIHVHMKLRRASDRETTLRAPHSQSGLPVAPVQ